MNISCTISGVPRKNSMYAVASHFSGLNLLMRAIAISTPRIVPNSTVKTAMISVLPTPSRKKLW